jgi:repressor LexA
MSTSRTSNANLERKGYIKRSYNESRAIEILPSEIYQRSVELPLLGTVAAGAPIEAMSVGETMSVPDGFLRKNGSHYVLRVRGESMIEEQIKDGDYVVINDRQTADNGEMVIALLDNSGATVKRYYRERDGRIRLQPANDTMTPLFVHEDDVRIQGIVVGVLRRY